MILADWAAAHRGEQETWGGTEALLIASVFNVRVSIIFTYETFGNVQTSYVLVYIIY